MTRLFYGSVMAGVVLVVLAAAVFPLPRHPRYSSSIDVIPDGGREETFVMHWPRDRVQVLKSTGAGPVISAGATALLPGEGGDLASGEVFRLRDTSGNVIGLASRSVSTRGAPGGVFTQGSDWILMIPSRGTLFLTQENAVDITPQPAAISAGIVSAADSAAFWGASKQLRITAGPAPGSAGAVVGGTQEFAELRGVYDETWTLGEAGADGATRGRITLVTRLQAVRP